MNNNPALLDEPEEQYGFPNTRKSQAGMVEACSFHTRKAEAVNPQGKL